MCGWTEVYSKIQAYALSKIKCAPIRSVFYHVVEAQLRISAIGGMMQSRRASANGL